LENEQANRLTQAPQMYNFYPKKLVQPPGRTQPILLIMKLTTLILITAILQVSANTFAQKVTLSEKNTPLNKIFDKIGEQTGYDFLISTDNLKASKLVTISLVNTELKLALEKIFLDQPLLFVMQEQIVIVSRKKEKGAVLPIQLPVNVTGRVTDTTGLPLVGATVKITNTNKVAITDSKGEFTLDAKEGDLIEISFIGYQTYSFVINNEYSFQTIVLHTTNAKLTEVNIVSTGYQSVPKERVTGSFSEPIKEMYNARVSTDVLTKLNGITSGLVFNANTSNVKSGQLDINIRGRSTIFANDQPLIVVDNFPYNGDISNINPNDVETLTVLKDAAAASIWGVRAGNGVIVITTKKGKLNQSLTVNFNANLTVFNKPNLNYNPNQLSASSYIDLEQYLFNQGVFDANLNDVTAYPVISPVIELLAGNRAGTISANSLTSQLNVLKKQNVNSQLTKYLYQKASNQQYAVNLSAGTDKINYFFSAGYDKILPNARGNAKQRITLNSQTTFYPVKKLEFNFGLNLVQTNNRTDNTLAQTASHIFPYSQLTDGAGNPLSISIYNRDTYIQNAQSNGFLDWSYLPLKELGAADNVGKNTDIRLSAGGKYNVISGLSVEIKYQFQRTNLQNRDFKSRQAFSTRNLINQFSILQNGKVSGYNIPLGGILYLSNSNAISNNLRWQLNYNKTWKDHNIAAIAGYEFSQVETENASSLLYGYDNDLATFTNINPTTSFNINPVGNASINSGLGISGALDRIRSSFTNVAYTYKGRYTLSGSARVDGSNYFGVNTNQKNLPLWSIGGKWSIAKEDFYKLAWLPVLNLRASFGYNGNLDKSLTGVTTFYYLSNAYYTNYTYADISNVGNPDLKWEKTGITNLAIDFGSANNTVSGSLEYYIKKETDLLGFKPFVTNTGITSLKGNYSNMKGQGFDLSVTTQNLRGKLSWTTTLLLSHATDEVTRYDVIPGQSALISADGNGNLAVPNVGKPVFSIYSYQWSGLDPSTGDPIGFINTKQSKDYTAIINNTPVAELIYSGSARPTYFGGLYNHFNYKGFGLSFQINYKMGYYFRNPTMSYSGLASGNSFLKVNRDYDNRWLKPGDENNTTVPSMIYPFNSSRDQFYQYAAVNVEKADHIRLQDISLSYDFNKSANRTLAFKKLQLFAYCNNVGILWQANHKGIDPDAVPGAGDIITISNPRSISFGLKGSF
jgi:TonB-linked SusC/RagA family outer membrane protein